MEDITSSATAPAAAYAVDSRKANEATSYTEGGRKGGRREEEGRENQCLAHWCSNLTAKLIRWSKYLTPGGGGGGGGVLG